MNFTPQSSVETMMLGMAILVVMLIIAFLLGRFTTPDNSRASARKAIFQLHKLAHGVAQNVGEHATRVREINHDLSVAKSKGTEVLDTLVIKCMAELIEANEQLQQQLTQAQVKLNEQAKELECQSLMAQTDALTNLPNRRAFDTELNRLFAQWQRRGNVFSLVMMDIDHFKQFNDQYGHQVGDAVLRGIARVLAASMRDMDIIARYGGEEFAALLPATNVAEGVHAAERAREAIEACVFHAEGQQLKVTLSLGVAEIRRGDSAQLLVKRVDEALYAAKSAGRNRVFVHTGDACQPIAPPAMAERQRDARPVSTTSPDRLPAAGVADICGHATAGSSANPSSRILSRTNFHLEISRRLQVDSDVPVSVSLLLIEVSDFRNISQRMGSAVGDFVLETVIESCKQETSANDLISHYAYGQVAVMMPDTEYAAATSIAKRIRCYLAESTGNSQFPQLRFATRYAVATAEPGEDVHTLIARANVAMPAVKNADAAALLNQIPT